MKTQNTKITKNIVLALLAISSINAAASYNATAQIKQVRQSSLISNSKTNVISRVALEDITKSLNIFSKTEHGFVSSENVVKRYNELVTQLKDGDQITLDPFFFNVATIKNEDGTLKVKVGNAGYVEYTNDVEQYLSENANNLFSIKPLLEEIKKAYNGSNDKNDSFTSDNQKSFNAQIEKLDSLIANLFTGSVYTKNDKAEEDKINKTNNKKNREAVIKEFYNVLNQATKDGALETTVKLNNGLYYNYNMKNFIIVYSIVVILLALATLAYYYYV